MSPKLTESTVEEAALQWLEKLGYDIFCIACIPSS